MGLQNSGRISLQDIVDEFGGTAPHRLKEYYGVSGVPSSGRISLKSFYGASSSLLTYKPGDPEQSLYFNKFLRENSLVNLQFTFTDIFNKEYSIRIEKLGVNSANVKNGSGDIFQLDNISYTNNNTFAYIHKDHNDTLEKIFHPGVEYSGTNIAYGSWNPASGGQDILNPGNERYAFRVTADGSTAIIDLASAEDSYLFLLDENENVLVSNDDGGSGFNARILRTLDTGTYYIVASTFTPGKTSNYTLAISGSPTVDNLTRFYNDGAISLIFNDTVNIFDGGDPYLLPSSNGFGYMYNSSEALKARSARRGIEHNGIIYINDKVKMGSGDKYSYACGTYGYDSKYWTREFGYDKMIVKGECWNGLSFDTTFPLNKTNIKKYEIVNF